MVNKQEKIICTNNEIQETIIVWKFILDMDLICFFNVCSITVIIKICEEQYNYFFYPTCRYLII